MRLPNIFSQFRDRLGIPYKLHVDSDRGSGPPIILLHGIATTSASWQTLVPLLDSKFRCISIDLLGFDESPKPAGFAYTIDQHVASIRRTIKSLRLNEPYILMGHSMGSFLAARYAGLYTKEVRNLFVLSPPLYINPADLVSARSRWMTKRYSQIYKYFREHKDMTLKGAKQLQKLSFLIGNFELTEATWVPFTKSLEECIEKQHFLKDMRMVNCPAELFYGRFDQLIISSNFRVFDDFANVTIYPVNASHAINNQYAKSVAKTVLSLLTKD